MGQSFSKGRDATKDRRARLSSRRSDRKLQRSGREAPEPNTAAAVKAEAAPPADAVAAEDARRRAACDAFYAAKCRPGFKGVTDVTAEELLARADLAEAVLLVDCRAPKEIAVSKLAGSVSQEAFNAGWEAMLLTGGGGGGGGGGGEAATPAREVVMYCTIGGRSGAAAKAFGAAHPEVTVSNFKGSLIEWAHAGGGFVDAEGLPTRRVHAWGRKFGDMMPQGVEVVV